MCETKADILKPKLIFVRITHTEIVILTTINKRVSVIQTFIQVFTESRMDTEYYNDYNVNKSNDVILMFAEGYDVG